MTTTTHIPFERFEFVSQYAEKRAAALGLDWPSLTEAHKQGIRETVWAELNWHD